MLRLTMAVAATVVVVAFSMANGHHVEVGTVVGEPIRIRLAFLLWIAFIAGFLGTTFYGMAVQLRRARRARAARQRAGQRPAEVDDDLDLEEAA